MLFVQSHKQRQSTVENENWFKSTWICYSLRCSKFGPIFGSGDDICIADNANTTRKNYSRLGHTYKHPQYGFETNEAKKFLAGSNRFQLDEIEVYQKKE